MTKHNIFGSIVDESSFQSKYVPLFAFKSDNQTNLAQEYIYDQVFIFFKSLDIVTCPKDSVLPTAKIISKKDFMDVKIEYFYYDIFSHLGERNVDNKLESKVMWAITLDMECTPLTNKHRHYGTIDINRTPIFYYIYFTIQEILDAIK